MWQNGARPSRLNQMIEAHRNSAAETVHCGDHPSRLARELAPAEAPSVWGPLTRLPTPEVVDLASLQTFLESYHAEVMRGIELPAVCDACGHTARYEVRELIALDAAVGRTPALARFVEASRAAGRRQLRRLLPLRDQRLVRRYWHAIEQGEAFGCHAVVFGMTLSLFSLPLRQGLLHYAHQTLNGFVRAGARRLALPASGVSRVLDDVTGTLPATVNGLLADEREGIRVVR